MRAGTSQDAISRIERVVEAPTLERFEQLLLEASPRGEGVETRYGQLHILKEPKGGRAFDEMRERALVVNLDGNEVAIVSLDDLIRMKRAAGRPGDLDDIAALAEVARRERD